MADKNLARSGPADADLLSDDDPLAELARIVGYEPRNVPTAARPVPPEPLQEPVFDLEGELLREFALYDAPALDPAGEFEDAPQPLAEPVSFDRDETLEETFGEVPPAVEAVEAYSPGMVEPAYVEPSYEEEVASPQAEQPASDAVADWQDEPAFDEAALAEPAFSEPPADVAPVSDWDAQPAYEGEQTAPAVEHADEYLEDEYPQAVAYEASQVEVPVAQATAEYGDAPAAPTFLGLQPADYPATFEEPVGLDLDQELELSLGEALVERSEPSEPPVLAAQEDAAPVHAWPMEESYARHETHAYDPAAAGYAVVDSGDAHAGLVQETFVEALPAVAPHAEATFAAAPTYADPVPVTPALGEGAHFEAEELPVEIGSVDFVPDWIADPHADAALAAAEEALSPYAEDAAVFEPPHPYEVAPPARAADGFDLDELLAEVERFPVPESRPPLAPSLESSLAAPMESSPEASQEAPRPRPGMLEGFSNVKFGRATPVAAARPSVAAPEPGALPETAFETAFVEPAAAEPFAVEPTADVAVPATVDTALVAPAAEPFPSVAPAVESEASDLDDAFANFELDLSDIEFDLDASELMPSEPVEPPSAPAVAAIAAATVASAAPPATPIEVERAVPASATIAPAPVAPAPIAAVPPVVPQAEQAFARTVEPVRETEQAPVDFVLPFDPSLIADTDVSVAQVGELDVPHLPAVDREKPPVHQPEYDLDIDAEMANLFGDPAPAPAPSRAAEAAVAANVVQFKPATGDAEAFDKALEEDLRRSLSQPERHAIPLDAQQADDDDYVGDGYDEPARRGRGLMLAAAAATVVVLGGAGVYAFLAGTGAVGTGSGEPRVIAADKTPVKIVPEERGGKSVPNQDKAVYDRVAGKSDSGPQQEQLVTSTEEPVDVVQRTLTPESLPYDGPVEDDATAPAEIAAGDDERLLPGVDDQAASQDAGEGNSPVVSPRKVRTMIVKPDGTLVAREEPAAPAETTGPALAEATQPPASADAGLRAEPSNGAPLPNGDERALQELAGAAVEETAPVRTVTTTPVVATSVAATGITAPDAAAAPAPQGEVMAGAPVPVSRPAEQPVDVVGTVSERGRVTGTAPTETAALATEPAAQPAAAAPEQAQPAAANPGGYVIQIASLPSEAEAQTSYNNLSSRFGSVIGGRGVDIKRAEIANKGTYYRVRIPAGSREEANALCAKYKAAGGSCLVTR
ncbi:SPOR domain-containing protein [Rhizobium sp. TRM96647]|uniref:SPOR domain-containing protein n=1 Tax=unclassified Rhizobium TaxID=2613769 RepID=UPI0021E6F693|nr:MULTISPECIES: SPOR domain-containing protein [unclassified Rhizobium]MCV3737748.1 SPOR domain-containing protein [Rhizobium sp. TRM96647]MCV3759522.1 SPOR domain-containing protein [Rhizobium sp. TRM96650]